MPRFVILPLLIRDRRLAAALALAGSAQIAATLAHVGGITCPFLHLTGLPCPGCGLSRACAALVRGEWKNARTYHAFSPFFLAAIAFAAVAAVWPAGVRRDAFLERVWSFERRWNATFLLLVLAIVYWVGRLVYAPDETIRLMGSGF